MKVLLKNYTDSSTIVEFDRETGCYLEVNIVDCIIVGFFEFKNNIFFAFYTVNNEKFFFEGVKEIKLSNDINSQFINSPNEGFSSFHLYNNNNSIFDISYSSWWASMQGFKPEQFIIEAREEDIEYDFFAYINSNI